eukprot:gnl/Dysnectes_brevis/5758_a8476_598.p1 GENE.gnl/Dysnectes_brevis/5758_a8476_598~~gnl/Dysnectes_brevis/5758_a8476_598.p1  ORF type:complete len:581 (+),score=98.79 gnl/Dysnectes_brevis/5758_a8476_598:47-1789(+)
MQQRLDQAIILKNEANASFKKSQFNQAIKTYSRALSSLMLEGSLGVVPGSPEFIPTIIILLSNRAMAYRKCGKWIESIIDSYEALNLDPKNYKAAYSYILGLVETNQLEDAFIAFKDMNSFIPSSSSSELKTRIDRLVTAWRGPVVPTNMANLIISLRPKLQSIYATPDGKPRPTTAVSSPRYPTETSRLPALRKVFTFNSREIATPEEINNAVLNPCKLYTELEGHLASDERGDMCRVKSHVFLTMGVLHESIGYMQVRDGIIAQYLYDREQVLKGRAILFNHGNIHIGCSSAQQLVCWLAHATTRSQDYRTMLALYGSDSGSLPEALRALSANSTVRSHILHPNLPLSLVKAHARSRCPVLYTGSLVFPLNMEFSSVDDTSKRKMTMKPAKCRGRRGEAVGEHEGHHFALLQCPAVRARDPPVYHVWHSWEKKYGVSEWMRGCYTSPSTGSSRSKSKGKGKTRKFKSSGLVLNYQGAVLWATALNIIATPSSYVDMRSAAFEMLFGFDLREMNNPNCSVAMTHFHASPFLADTFISRVTHIRDRVPVLARMSLEDLSLPSGSKRSDELFSAHDALAFQ